jgi:cathepsin D
MHFFLAPIFAVGFLLVSAARTTQKPRITIPLNKRTDIYRSDGSVDIKVLKRQTAQSTAYVILNFNPCESDLSYSKIVRGFNAYERNTGQRHPSSLGIKNFKRGVAHDPLTNDQSSQLVYGDMSVGTPPVEYSVNFDTGSSDLYLPGETCGSCGDHTRYNPSASSSSKDLGETFSLKFIDGSNVTGSLFTDNVTIAGLTATQQTLGAATYFPISFEYLADGVMGLGFQSISSYNAPPLWQSLFAEGQIDFPVFAMKLTTGGSEMSIGGLNSDLYTGNITFVPVSPPGYWQANFTALTVGGKSVVNESTSFIIDTVRSHYYLLMPLD